MKKFRLARDANLAAELCSLLGYWYLERRCWSVGTSERTKVLFIRFLSAWFVESAQVEVHVEVRGVVIMILRSMGSLLNPARDF